VTSVRYFPRSRLVMVKDFALTITFRADDVGEINPQLAVFGFHAVRDWRQDNGQLQGYTCHTSARAAA